MVTNEVKFVFLVIDLYILCICWSK